MPLGLFTPPSGRGLVIPVFFPCFFFFFLVVTCPRLPETPAKYKHCSVVHRRFAKIFMKVGVENYLGCTGVTIPSTRARTKMLASFESHRFGVVYIFVGALNKVKYSTGNASIFLTVLLWFAKICRKTCVKKYKEFIGVNFSSMRARTKMLASFESWHEFAIKRAVTHKHYTLHACGKSLIESRPKNRFFFTCVSCSCTGVTNLFNIFLGRYPFLLDFRVILSRVDIHQFIASLLRSRF